MSDETDREALANWRRDEEALAKTPYSINDPHTDWNSSDQWRIVRQEDVTAALWSSSLEPAEMPHVAEADSREAAEALLLRMSIEALES